MSIIIKKYTKKQLKKRDEEENLPKSVSTMGLHHIDGNGDDIIEIPYKASTKTKIHEMSHAKLKHDTTGKTYLSILIMELDAEIETALTMNKKVTWRVAINPVNQILNAYPTGIGRKDGRRYNIHWMFNTIIFHLKERGYPLNKSDRSKLWWYLRKDIVD